MHGFALNLTVEPQDYRWIVPCGIRDHAVASVTSLTGARPDVAEVALSAAAELGSALGLELDSVEDRAALGDPAELAAELIQPGA
jgi:lipoate-protein ligase B